MFEGYTRLFRGLWGFVLWGGESGERRRRQRRAAAGFVDLDFTGALKSSNKKMDVFTIELSSGVIFRFGYFPGFCWQGERGRRQQRTLFFALQSAPAAMSAATICWCPAPPAKMSAVSP